MVDDASEDGTGEHILSRYPDVRIVKNDIVRGQGHSRNIGVETARGDYIALCDHDDVWASSHLGNVAGLLDQYPEAPLAFSRVGLIGNASGCWPASPGSIPEKPEQLFIQLMRNNIIIPTGTIFRNELWREAGPFDESLPLGVDDYRFYLETAIRYPVVGQREPTAFWRIHIRQASRKRKSQVIRAFEHRLDMLEWYQKRFTIDSRYKLAQDAILRCWEEHIEEAWATRNLLYLRGMVQFGWRKPILRKATLPYLWKAAVPQFLLRRLVDWKVIRLPKKSIIQAER